MKPFFPFPVLVRLFFAFLPVLATCVFAFAWNARAQGYQDQYKCDRELREGYQNFLKKLRAKNFSEGVVSSGRKSKELERWLKQVNAEVIRHERAHAQASGKWAGKIEYFYYKWWNIPYAVAGCHRPKDGIPLEVRLKAALAPQHPSERDFENARYMKRAIEAKKARQKCWANYSGATQRQCLARYEGFAWVDRYPLR